MALSARAKKLVAEITNGSVKLGDIKTRGKEIKKDHDLAMELWSTGEYYPRLLAILTSTTLMSTRNGSRVSRRRRTLRVGACSAFTRG